MTCKHDASHVADCKVIHLEDTGRFMIEINVACGDCGKPYVFLGLPAGLNMNGAAVSVDGLTALLSIAPQGTEPAPIDLIGYAIHGGPTQ